MAVENPKRVELMFDALNKNSSHSISEIEDLIGRKFLTSNDQTFLPLNYKEAVILEVQISELKVTQTFHYLEVQKYQK